MKRKLTITLELESAAFAEHPAQEASRILVGLAAGLELDGFENFGSETDSGAAGGLWDHNGNWTGFWRVLLDDRLDSDPYRWEQLQLPELEYLRLAIHRRLHATPPGCQDAPLAKGAERKVLEQLERELNLETERRQ
jgi:hypothetical protein